MSYMAVDGQYAYVGVKNTTPLVVVNLWPTDSPSVFTEIEPDQPWLTKQEVVVEGGYMYEIYAYAGFRILDLY